jgi:hypothetical protein
MALNALPAEIVFARETREQREMFIAPKNGAQAQAESRKQRALFIHGPSMDAASAFVMREIDLRTCLLPPQKWHSKACNCDSIYWCLFVRSSKCITR